MKRRNIVNPNQRPSPQTQPQPNQRPPQFSQQQLPPQFSQLQQQQHQQFQQPPQFSQLQQQNFQQPPQFSQQQQKQFQQQQQQPLQNQITKPITSIRGQAAFAPQGPPAMIPQNIVQSQVQRQPQSQPQYQPKNELLQDIDENQIKYGPKLTIQNAITLLSLRMGKSESILQELQYKINNETFENEEDNGSKINNSVFENIVERLNNIESFIEKYNLALSSTQEDIENIKTQISTIQNDMIVEHPNNIFIDQFEQQEDADNIISENEEGELTGDHQSENTNSIENLSSSSS